MSCYTNYSKIILAAAKNQALQGTVDNANLMGTISNVSCQDSLTITGKINAEGVIANLLYQGNGCILSQGSCALLVQYCLGKKIAEFRNLPEATFFEIVPVENPAARQECFLLGWQALNKGIKAFKQ